MFKAILYWMTLNLLFLKRGIISVIYSSLVLEVLHSQSCGIPICFAIRFIKIDLGADKMLTDS